MRRRPFLRKRPFFDLYKTRVLPVRGCLPISFTISTPLGDFFGSARRVRASSRVIVYGSPILALRERNSPSLPTYGPNFPVEANTGLPVDGCVPRKVRAICRQ